MEEVSKQEDQGQADGEVDGQVLAELMRRAYRQGAVVVKATESGIEAAVDESRISDAETISLIRVFRV